MKLAIKLHPLMTDFKTLFSDMVTNFNKIGSTIDKAHNIMKATYH